MSRTRHLAASVFLGFILLAAGLVWLARGDTALGWAARWAVSASGGRLSLEDPRGGLFGPIRIGGLSWETETRRVRLRDIDLEWRPQALWQGRLEILRLGAAELRVEEIRPDNEPLRLPETLALPVGLSLPEVRVARLTVIQGGRGYAFSDLSLALEKPADRYRLTLRRLATPWGDLTGRGEMAERRPYALTADARLDQPGKHRIGVRAGGELGRIRIQAEASRPLVLRAHALVTPFAPLPLETAHIEADGVDPSHWLADWPGADLAVQSDFTLAEGGRVVGSMAVENRRPGPWDRARMPLVRLSGRFDGNRDDVAFSGLLLDLGAGGSLRGAGRWLGERLHLDLVTGNLDPHVLYGRLRAMRLAGKLSLSAGRDDQALRARLTHGAYALDLGASRRGDQLRIAVARLAAPQGSLTAGGSVGLAANQAFDLRGSLNHFNPASFGDFPAADLNAELGARGHLAPQPGGSVDFTLAYSRLRGQPLRGRGRVVLEAGRVKDSQVALNLADNRLDFHGAFGRPGDRLSWRLDAARLDRLDPRLRGRLSGEGSLGGSRAQPDIGFRAHGEGLSWAGRWSLARLRAQGRLEAGLDGPLEIDATLDGLKGEGLELAEATLKGGGTRAGHRLQATAQGGVLEARAVLQGRWRDGVWQGQLRELENRGRHALLLHAPANLLLAGDGMRLDNAALDYAGARFTLRDLNWREGVLASRGAVTGLRPAVLADLWSIPRDWRGTLRMGGEWDVSLGDTANGRAAAWRESGDLVIATDPATPLGLDGLRLTLEARNNALAANLESSGSTLGILDIRAHSRLSRRDGSWGLPGDAPLAGEVVFGLPSLGWLAPILDRTGNLVLAGVASARLDLRGSLAHPRLDGDLAGEEMRLDWPAVGLKFGDGSVAAHLEDDRLDLSRFVVRAGEGQLTARGTAAWRGAEPVLDLTWAAERLQALSRPDRQLTVSGTGRLAIQGKQVEVQGKLKADRALIVLPKAGAPTRSEDVVVVGREAKAEVVSPLRVALDLGLDLGDGFILKGRGLDARLAGNLRLRAAPRALPRATGTVRVAKGSYTAYGQKLNIERGLVDFQGPLDNPGLDILATRGNQDVVAGVALTGTVQAPHAKLVSTPEVPDTEKLSWLVLGRGTESASSVDLNLLASAASAILAAGESVSLQARIAQRTGLDEMGLKGGGELENTVLALGKRLSDQAYLTYEQGLTGVGNLVKLNYTLSRRWSVQAQTGRETAVDLFYTLGFD